MIPFEWVEPASISELFTAKASYGDEAKIIAGGTWVTLVLSQGLLYPSALISLRRVPGLNNIHLDTHGLTIGAMVTHRQIENDATIKKHCPVLAETFSVVANVRIRNQATIGGCICDADYASDPPAMLAALGAAVHLQRPGGERWVAMENFITGHYETIIQPDELLTAVRIPSLSLNMRGVYIKYRTRSHEDRPCVGIAVILGISQDVVSHLRIVVGAVAATPQRVVEGENLAIGQQLTNERAQQIGEAYAESIEPIDDLRGSSWYRRETIRVLVKRALLQARERSSAA
jgi:aerobic carbon-monoxide dehydrogenase medium subunit